MQITAQDAVLALDPDFGPMAVERGRFAWGLPHLSMREKAFVFVAADMCTRALQFPLHVHVRMAVSNGVALEDIREAVRHLAPYAGYPTAAETLMRLREISEGDSPDGEPTQRGRTGERATTAVIGIPPSILEDLDERFATFVEEQFAQRWGRSNLSVAERALCTIATDVLNGTLTDSFRWHVELALEHGATEEQVREVLLLVAEFGLAKSWRAFTALEHVLVRR